MEKKIQKRIVVMDDVKHWR